MIDGLFRMIVIDKNNNALVFDTIDNALLRNPGAQPLFLTGFPIYEQDISYQNL